jgi:hypothetical protein
LSTPPPGPRQALSGLSFALKISIVRALVATPKGVSLSQRFVLHIEISDRIITWPPFTKRRANLLVKEVWRLNIQQANRGNFVALWVSNSGGLLFADPVQWRSNGACLPENS